MRKLLAAFMVLSLTLFFAGCACIPGRTDLSDVADDAGLTNVTTGDGTFENYTATGYYTGIEIGIAVGLPGIFKFIELYPKQSNEELMVQIADRAKEDGADAMINVTPTQESYLGFPFMIVGLYIDTTAGTGIDLK